MRALPIYYSYSQQGLGDSSLIYPDTSNTPVDCTNGVVAPIQIQYVFDYSVWAFIDPNPKHQALDNQRDRYYRKS